MVDTLVNGEPGEAVSVHDRGLQFGDGVFETIAVQSGTPLCWDAHLARLDAGCRRLSIPAPDAGTLKREAGQLCGERALAVLKIIVTRGAGGRGYQPPTETSGARILTVYDWQGYPPAYSRDGIDSFICRQRIARLPELAGIKHLSRLEQILLRREIADTPCPEGVALDRDDNVIEGSMSNIFMIKNGVLITPDLSLCGVEGVIRGSILEIAAAAGYETVVRAFKPAELLTADGVFYCNSLIGIWPVRRIDNKMFRISHISVQLGEKLAANHCIMRVR